ncbi:MAG: hypothetical protein QXH65_07555 [Thermofilaceae archaeon]
MEVGASVFALALFGKSIQSAAPLVDAYLVLVTRCGFRKIPPTEAERRGRASHKRGTRG